MPWSARLPMLAQLAPLTQLRGVVVLGAVSAYWVCASVQPARAEVPVDVDEPRPSASLTYERQRGAERCPDDAELRDAVSARLGYVPFRDDAPQHVRTVIRAERGGLLATVDVFDADGEVVGQREIRSRTRDCEELARGVALAISVAIDPVSLLGPPTDPAPQPDPGPAPTGGDATRTPEQPTDEAAVTPDPGTEGPDSAPEMDPPGELAPNPSSDVVAASPPGEGASRDAMHTWLALDGQLTYEVVPQLRPAVALRLVVERARWATELVVRGVFPASATSTLGRVTAWQTDLHAYACGKARFLRGCAGAFVGVMPARGARIDQPRRGVGLVTGAALALGFDHLFGQRFTFSARVGVDVPLLRPRLELDDTRVWRGAPVSGLVSVGIGARLR
ncbi:MAG: hypothetical protein R3B40_12970 [Polyangiales bacterium]